MGFGLWALGFGLWALGFGFWVLGFGFRASAFRRGQELFKYALDRVGGGVGREGGVMLLEQGDVKGGGVRGLGAGRGRVGRGSAG